MVDSAQSLLLPHQPHCEQHSPPVQDATPEPHCCAPAAYNNVPTIASEAMIFIPCALRELSCGLVRKCCVDSPGFKAKPSNETANDSSPLAPAAETAAILRCVRQNGTHGSCYDDMGSRIASTEFKAAVMWP